MAVNSIRQFVLCAENDNILLQFCGIASCYNVYRLFSSFGYDPVNYSVPVKGSCGFSSGL